MKIVNKYYNEYAIDYWEEERQFYFWLFFKTGNCCW